MQGSRQAANGTAAGLRASNPAGPGASRAPWGVRGHGPGWQRGSGAAPVGLPGPCERTATGSGAVPGPLHPCRAGPAWAAGGGAGGPCQAGPCRGCSSAGRIGAFPGSSRCRGALATSESGPLSPWGARMLAVPGGGGEVRPGRRGRGAFRRAPAAAGEPGGRGVRGEDGPLLAVRRQRPRPGEAERSLSAARAAGPGGRWLGGGAPRGAAVRSVAVKGTLLRMCFFFIIFFSPSCPLLP